MTDVKMKKIDAVGQKIKGKLQKIKGEIQQKAGDDPATKIKGGLSKAKGAVNEKAADLKLEAENEKEKTEKETGDYIFADEDF